MISIALCDDEQRFLDFYEKRLNILSRKLKTTIEVIKFSNSDALLFYLEDRPTHFDIIFLDILLDKSNGIDVGYLVKRINPKIKLIFLTSSEHFVYDAFGTNPVDYLIKGRDDNDKLNHVFEKTINSLSKTDNTDFFVHDTRTKKMIIPFHEIIYFEIFKRIMLIHLHNNETLQIYKSLGDLEQEVSEKGFVRVNRSFLVNIQYIKSIRQQSVFLKDNTELPIGRKYYHSLRETLNQYLTRGDELS